jgi:hypothetical protein
MNRDCDAILAFTVGLTLPVPVHWDQRASIQAALPALFPCCAGA